MAEKPPSKRRNTGPGPASPTAPDNQDPLAIINALQAQLEEMSLHCRHQNQVIEDLRFGPMSICGSEDTRTGHPCRNVRGRCHLRFNGEHTDYQLDEGEQRERARLCGSTTTKSGKPCRNKFTTCHLRRTGAHE
jgi:hypothetical protein